MNLAYQPRRRPGGRAAPAGGHHRMGNHCRGRLGSRLGRLRTHQTLHIGAPKRFAPRLRRTTRMRFKRATILACLLTTAWPLAGCTTSDVSGVPVLRAAIGSSLAGAKGKTVEDQNKIDGTIPRGCAVKLYTAAECDRHTKASVERRRTKIARRGQGHADIGNEKLGNDDRRPAANHSGHAARHLPRSGATSRTAMHEPL